MKPTGLRRACAFASARRQRPRAEGRDGLCHISELSNDYVGTVTDICNVGDEIDVKVIAVDEQDRVKLSNRAAHQELAGAASKNDESAWCRQV